MRQIAFIGRDCQTANIAPSNIQAVGNRSVSDAAIPTPLRQAFSDAVQGQSSIVARVLSLFRVCCPTYIAFFVMSFVVDSIQSVPRTRLTPNFLQELFVGFKTKLNSSSTVIFVGGVIRILATSFCPTVRTVFWCVTRPTRFAVSTSQFTRNLFAKTSTRYSFACGKMFSGDCFNRATFALAFPIFSVRGRDADKTQYGQSSILVARQVNNKRRLFTFRDLYSFRHIGIAYSR